MAIGFQTLINPATGQVRVVDISGGTSEVLKLYQKGWQSYSGPGSHEIGSQAVKQAVKYQKQLAALSALPMRSPQQQSTPLTKYVKDGQINLADLWTEKDYYAINYAKGVYGNDALDKAKTISDLTTKTPILVSDYIDLPESERNIDKYRFIKPTSLGDYNEMDEIEKASHYIESKGVGSGTYSKLGPGTKKIFHPDLSTWEKVTPWKEQEGQTATTKNILLWEAEIAVPFVYVARHWDEMSNQGRALHLVLDAFIVGAIAAKPAKKILSTATQTLLSKSYGKAGGKVVMGELAALDNAVTMGDRTAIQTIASRLESLGKTLKAQGIDGAEALITNGRRIKAKAQQISEGLYDINPLARKVHKGTLKLARDESGYVGRYRVVPKPSAPPPASRRAAVETIPLSRREAARSGVTEGQLEGLWKKAGGHENTFHRLAREQADKNKRMWRDINKAFESKPKPSTIKEGEPIHTTTKRLPTPSDGQHVTLRSNIERRIAEIEHQRERIGKLQKQPKTDKLVREAEEGLEKLRGDLGALVKRAKANEDKIKAMGKKAVDEANEMLGRGQLRALERWLSRLGETELVTLLFADTRGMIKVLAGVATKAKAAALAKLDTALATAVAAALAAKTAAQAKAVAAVQTQTATATALALGTAVRVAPQTATKTKTKPATKPATEVVISPITHVSRPYVPAPIPTPTPKPPTPPRTPPPGTPPPGKPPPGKPRPRRPGRGSKKYEIKKVEGIPENAGRLSFNSGIVKVTLLPPYRQGTDDIDYDRLKKPQTGKGSQEATLRVTGGDAPARVVLSRGIDELTILSGKRMTHVYAKGPNVLIGKGGKRQRQRRGQVI